MSAPRISSHIFGKCLVVTNTFITMSLTCIGDIIQQSYERLKKRRKNIVAKWNWRRTRHYTTTGAVIGPICHYWYQFLDMHIVGPPVSAISKKIAVDQLLFSPFLIVLFLGTMAVLEKTEFPAIKYDKTKLLHFLKRDTSSEPLQYSLSAQMAAAIFEFKSSMKTKFWDLFVADSLLWPPAQVINFYFLPTKYRVLYDNVVDLIFDSYYSYVLFHEEDEDDDKDNKEENHIAPADKTSEKNTEVKSLVTQVHNIWDMLSHPDLYFYKHSTEEQHKKRYYYLRYHQFLLTSMTDDNFCDR